LKHGLIWLPRFLLPSSLAKPLELNPRDKGRKQIELPWKQWDLYQDCFLVTRELGVLSIWSSIGTSIVNFLPLLLVHAITLLKSILPYLAGVSSKGSP
jgi:hypothetical protein